MDKEFIVHNFLVLLLKNCFHILIVFLNDSFKSLNKEKILKRYFLFLFMHNWFILNGRQLGELLIKLSDRSISKYDS